MTTGKRRSGSISSTINQFDVPHFDETINQYIMRQKQGKINSDNIGVQEIDTKISKMFPA
jgi:hypothetical protein